MIKILGLLTSILALCTLTVDAKSPGSRRPAATCGVAIGNEGRVQSIIAAIRASANCSEAVELAQACAYEAVTDISLADAAIDVCGRDFSDINHRDGADMDLLSARCNAKFKGKPGPGSLAQAAFCRLRVAQAFSALYAPAP